MNSYNNNNNNLQSIMFMYSYLLPGADGSDNAELKVARLPYLSCDVHNTHTPAQRSSTNFILYPFAI